MLILQLIHHSPSILLFHRHLKGPAVNRQSSAEGVYIAVLIFLAISPLVDPMDAVFIKLALRKIALCVAEGAVVP